MPGPCGGGGHDLRGQVVPQILRPEAEGRGDAGAIGHRSEARGPLVHAGGLARQVHLEKILPRLHNLGHARLDVAERAQAERGAEGRMAGERKLPGGREDPHPVPGGLVLHHERRLGEPDLVRQGLHELGGEVLPVGHDAELVPGERRLGEHVEEQEPDAHGLMLRGPVGEAAGTLRDTRV